MSSQVQVLTTCSHVLTCYILIIRLELGVFGAAMALNITYTLNFLLQEIYVNCYLWDELKFFSAHFCISETFQDWGKFLKLGVPGTFQQCFEWWAFEVLAIFAGMLGTVYLAAHVAVINVCAIIFMIPLGIQFTASGLVGCSIGENNSVQAKRYAMMAVLYSLLLSSLVSICLVSFPDQIARAFTKDQPTIEVITQTLPIIAIYILFSGF